MVQPLALFLYEKLLPSGQLVNRFQDKGYRVQSIGDPTTLVDHAEREKPLVVLADLESRQYNVALAIGELKKNAGTAHIPVIAFASAAKASLQEDARTAGATLVVNDTAILAHLDQFLDQALQVD
ncbi:MAG: Response regulator receiver protein [Verrucomicrobiales bacterium]|nr:Response regulator receiver protein [Verrucomicrobiales bacterium]